MVEQDTVHSDVHDEQTGQAEVGRVVLNKPWNVDAQRLGECYFPRLYYRTFTAPSGDVCICENRPNDEVDRTILLFEKPTRKGFTSVYSPLTPQALKATIDAVFAADARTNGNFVSDVRTKDRGELLEHLHLEESAS